MHSGDPFGNGDYVKLQELGHGAYGVVYKARRAGGDDHVAVKVIKKSKLARCKICNAMFATQAQLESHKELHKARTTGSLAPAGVVGAPVSAVPPPPRAAEREGLAAALLRER